MLQQLQNVCTEPVFDDFPSFDAKEVHTCILNAFPNRSRRSAWHATSIRGAKNPATSNLVFISERTDSGCKAVVGEGCQIPADPLLHKEAITQAFAADATEQLHQVYDTILSSEVITLPLQAFVDTFIDMLVACNRHYPGYLALELGSTISSPLAVVLADLHQGIMAHLDAMIAARWPQSTQEQRHLPLLVSYRLFFALLPLVLHDEGEHQHAIVREMKVFLYRYWQPIMGTQRASVMLSHEIHASEG